MIKAFLFPIALAGGLAASGCGDRTVMSEGHGRSFRQIFVAQVANPTAGVQARPTKNLDSQEATIIATGYRDSLSRKGSRADDQQMLMVAPQDPRSGYFMPPPSVPQGK